MSLDNLITVSYTTEELKQIDDAMTVIETIICSKAISLTPKQRQQYGRVSWDMETWIQKVYEYMKQLPHLIPPYIDMEEHDRDMEAHYALGPRVDKLNIIRQSMMDTNLLLGTDIYNNSLAFYRSLREAAKVNVVGAGTAYSDLKRQFSSGSGKKSNSDTDIIA